MIYLDEPAKGAVHMVNSNRSLRHCTIWLVTDVGKLAARQIAEHPLAGAHVDLTHESAECVVLQRVFDTHCARSAMSESLDRPADRVILHLHEVSIVVSIKVE